MSSGLDWERFGVITGGDEVCILPPPTLSEKGVGIPTLSISLFLKIELFFKDPEDVCSRSTRLSASYTY